MSDNIKAIECRVGKLEQLRGRLAGEVTRRAETVGTVMAELARSEGDAGEQTRLAQKRRDAESLCSDATRLLDQTKVDLAEAQAGLDLARRQAALPLRVKAAFAAVQAARAHLDRSSWQSMRSAGSRRC